MYNSGHTIIVVPSRCGVENTVAKATLNIIDNKGARFEQLINTFEYFNCNKELGYYSHYYVSEAEMEQYNMCLSMCSSNL